MRPAVRRAAIQRNHPKLSLTRHCELLSISGSSLCCPAVGESPETLARLRKFDRMLTAYPFFGSRQIGHYLA